MTPFRLLCLASFILNSINFQCYAQDGAGFLRTDLISPSPTAAQLSKYGDIPVTYYTGLPNVSVPIFNVTGNELSLPITLTYNYSGCQPGQKASWVGLGWSLQAGGVITRTVGDRLDGALGYDRDSASQMNPTQTYLKRSRYFGLFDNLPDVYSFNFAGYSGKFIYVNGTYYIMPKQKFKISGGGYGAFTITVDDGTTYTFEAYEQTTAKPTAPGGGSAYYNIPVHTSAWYLTKITNAANTESIRLTYVEDGTMEQLGVRTQSCRVNTSAINQAPLVSPPGDVLPTRVTVQRLRTITSSKYTVDFFPGASREDVTMYSGQTYSLGSIRITSRENVIKNFELVYDYAPGSSLDGKALRLKSVTETASGGQLYKHSFVYYNEDQSVGSGLYSPVDKFGYLRSGASGGNLISNEIWQYGVDRTPQFNVLVTGALKTLTYPTGGSTTFTYELNRIYDGNKNVMESRTGGASAIRYNLSSTNIIYAVDTFRVTHQQYVRVVYSRLDKDGPYDPQTDPTEVRHDNDAEVSIHPVYSLYDEEGNFESESAGIAVYSGTIVLNADNEGKTDSVLLSPGKYIVKAICDENEHSAGANIFYKFDTGVKSPGLPGPGLRVKSIDHDNGFGKVLHKNFSYVNQNGFSSGELLQGASYFQSEQLDVVRSTALFGGIVSTTPYNVYTSVVTARGDIGLPFYYKQVDEETESAGEIHKTTYSFDYFGGTQNVEMLSKTDYTQRGENFVTIAKDEFTLSSEYNYGFVNGLEIYVSEHHSYIENELLGYDFFGFNPKNWVEYWKYTPKVKNTRYENGMELVAETRSYYNPLGTRNLLATKQTLSDGTTLYTRYKYPEDYVGVSALAEMVLANMLTPVIEEQVWRKRPGSPPDSVLISGRINEYAGKRLKAVYVIEAGIGLKSLNAETKNGAGLYNRLISDTLFYKKKVQFSYDNAGRLVTQQLTDHPVISYHWGYPGHIESASPVQGGMYPVAEIKNALPEEVFYTSFEETGITTIEAFSGVRCKADSFKIKKSFVGSYMLTYWKKTGAGPWQLVTQTINNPSNYVINALGSYLDEVRLYPLNAQITTYTYVTGVGIRHTVDPNNKITTFEYDNANRLKVVRDDSKNIIKTYQYHVKDEVSITVE